MKRRTVMDMLLKRADEGDAFAEVDVAGTHSHAVNAASEEQYLKELTTAIDADHLDIAFQPLIFATHRSRRLAAEYKADRKGRTFTAADIFNIVSCPDVFVWLPDKIFPGIEIACQICGKNFASREWRKPRPTGRAYKDLRIFDSKI